MKKMFFLFLFLTSLSSFSQLGGPIEISNNGISSSISTIDELKSNELYLKTLEFISKKFENPNFVIKIKLENKLIRFSNYDTYKAKNALGNVELKYDIEIEFKEGKYKVSFYNVKFHNIYDVPRSLYNSKGEARTNSYYTSSHEQITIKLNEANKELYDFLITKDEW